MLRVIELESYQRAPHRADVIAAQLGISSEEEQKCVEALLTSGQVDWDGSRYRVGAQFTDTRHYPEAGRRLEIGWTRQALEHDEDGLFSYSLFAVPER